MKRTPLNRKTPLRASNPARKRERFARAYGSRARVLWIQSLPCLTCRKCPTEVAHVRSRGAGGTADDTVPLCRECHRNQHAWGIQTFERVHGIDLTQAARELADAWESWDR